MDYSPRLELAEVWWAEYRSSAPIDNEPVSPIECVGLAKITLGFFKVSRGAKQFSEAVDEPERTMKPLDFGLEILLGISPAGDSVENFLGGRP